MSMVRAARAWASLLSGASTPPPPHVMEGFAREFSQMADHADRQIEAAAAFLERRAELRGGEMVRVHLLASASDLRAGLHMGDTPPPLSLHEHADGGTYVYLGACAIKDDETGEWIDGVAYRAVDGPMASLLCTTSQQRWDARFAPVEDDQ